MPTISSKFEHHVIYFQETMNVYIEGYLQEDGVLKAPLSSAVILFLLNYCDPHSKSFHIKIVKLFEETNVHVAIPKICWENVSWTFVEQNDTPKTVNNCKLPAIEVWTKERLLIVHRLVAISQLVRLTINMI